MDIQDYGLEDLASQGTPMYVGFIAAGVAVILFGSNFVPVKKFETGDGMFFQWVLCSAILIVGIVVQYLRWFPTFYPFAMLGGVLWASGNITVVPIIKTIGLGQGILVWGSFNMLAGWIVGRFGIFGTEPEVPNNLTLNYIGVCLCLCSALINIFIKSESQTRVPQANDSIDENAPLISVPVSTNRVSIEDPDATFLESLSPAKKRILGVALAVISGILYGVSFTPAIYIQDTYPGASKNGLDYVFAHFCGIYTTSTFFFLVYCAFMQNQPRVYPKAIMPGFVSGIMWGAACSCWFVANAALSEPIAFPIITSAPAMIGALWGLLLFKEIKGRRNFIFLGLSFVVTVAGGVITGLSKI